MQLAALAFPAHPFAFAGVELAAPMQQQKARAGGSRTVCAIEPCDRLDGGCQQRGVAGQAFFVRIETVGKQREAEIAAGIGQMVHFQPLDLLQQIGFVAQQGRHRDQRAQFARYASEQLQAGKPGGTDTAGDQAVEQGVGQFGGRQQGHGGERQQPANAGSGLP